jgi:two-component system CheB/CheR fusion protein
MTDQSEKDESRRESDTEAIAERWRQGSASSSAVAMTPVVAIGTSAGGLAALERLFNGIEPNAGVAYVVLQHLAPDFDSHMTELLGRVTSMPVIRASDRMTLEPDSVFVMQPNTEMIMARGRLLLTDKDPRNAPSLPIDTFMRSMARDIGPSSVAIILSGTGSDGARGIREVKAAGGYVIVQSPEEAEFDGMPSNAVATGVADAVMPVDRMADSLRKVLRQLPRESEPHFDDENPLEERGFRRILRELADQRNIDFSVYRRPSLTRRIRRRMELRGVDDSEEYARVLASDPAEAKRLLHDLLIGVTEFFRDPAAFETLKKVVRDSLSEVRDEFRVWVAGCATGEEVYSLAMLLDEARRDGGWNGRIRIFATDIHKEALRTAGEGVYSRGSLNGVSEARLEKYFVASASGFKVSDALREMVIFAEHDVVVDAPFTQLDLVCCRNVLIYLQPATQARILALFHFGLRTGGLMFLGPSETVGKLEEEFDTVDAVSKVFRKRRDLRLSATTRLGRFDPQVRRREPAAPITGSSRFELELLETLVERSAPPSFLLDESMRLIHCFAGAERYFTLKPGKVSTDPLALLDGRLRTVVASLLDRLKADPTRSHAVELPGDPDESGSESLKVVISQLKLRRAGSSPILVELLPVKAFASPAVAGRESEIFATDYLTSLEHDLELARVQLQTTVEELEAANEELQATNEELVASNEELQSTNEELRSVNDELNAVNEEHQNKITELVEVTEDLQNLLHTINVGVLFIDQEVCVRRVNVRIGQLLHVLPQDVGRKFSQLNNVTVAEIVPIVEDVLSNRTPAEQEIVTNDERTLLLNVVPYESERQQQLGVVLTLVDLTSLRRAELEAGRLSEIVRSARDAIISKDLDGNILTWNAGAERLYGYSAEQAIGRPISIIVPEERRTEIGRILSYVAQGVEVEPFETVRITREGNLKHVLLSVAPLHSGQGKVRGASIIALDISDRKRAEERAALAIEQRDRFLAVLSHELRNPLMAMASANEILLRSDDSEAAAKRAKEIISRQVMQMSRLLEDTLDASRMRHDKIELQRKLIDLRDVVEVAMDAVRERANRNGVRIEMTLPDEPVNVKGDSTRLQQVITNLGQNAVNHSKQDQIVTLWLAVESDTAVIKVRDEGIGVAPSALPQLFEPFFQERRSRHGGLGLGLSLARAVTLAHRGEILARSDGIGKGAEFEVRLPIAENGDTQVDLPRLSQTGSDSVCSVVLIDDDEASRANIAYLMRHAGYDVHEAGNGEQGLELIASVMPSVAVVDIGLPDMSGLDVAKQIRKQHGSKQIRLLALTGFGQQTDREAAIEAGFDMHLVKPIDFATLEKVVAYQASR